jgi:tRNA 2-thiouridine synthesizing protein E
VELMMDPALNERLSAIEDRLDRLLDRQQAIDDLLADLGPIGRDALRTISGHLDRMERRGWMRVGAELAEAADGVVGDLRPDELRDLLSSTVGVLRTLRNVTRPDVLRIVNDAADVVHGASEVPAVGPLGLLGAGRDEDVQRGLGLLLELTRHVGRASRAMERAPGLVPGTASSGRFRRATEAAPPPALAPRPLAAPPADASAYDADRTIEAAEATAASLDLALTDAHRAVIVAARDDYAATGASPNVRRLTQVTGVSTKDLYALVPRAPGRTVARIAGLPKPAGCI